MNDRLRWFQFDSGALDSEVHKQHQRGVILRTRNSPYDIPTRVVAELSCDSKRLRLSFEYLGGPEQTKAVSIGTSALVLEGIHSGRMYGIEFNFAELSNSTPLQREQLTAKIAQVTEFLKARSQEAGSRHNERAGVSAKILDSVQERVIHEMVET